MGSMVKVWERVWDRLRGPRGSGEGIGWVWRVRATVEGSYRVGVVVLQ